MATVEVHCPSEPTDTLYHITDHLRSNLPLNSLSQFSWQYTWSTICFCNFPNIYLGALPNYIYCFSNVLNVIDSDSCKHNISFLVKIGAEWYSEFSGLQLFSIAKSYLSLALFTGVLFSVALQCHGTAMVNLGISQNFESNILIANPWKYNGFCLSLAGDHGIRGILPSEFPMVLNSMSTVNPDNEHLIRHYPLT